MSKEMCFEYHVDIRSEVQLSTYLLFHQSSLDSLLGVDDIDIVTRRRGIQLLGLLGAVPSQRSDEGPVGMKGHGKQRGCRAAQSGHCPHCR